ncbi:hypothetical protein MTO96_028688 [Rhipicephalus appendiculatus]
MCAPCGGRTVYVPCGGEEDDDLVRGVAREGGSVREPCARIGCQGCLLRWASGPWENPQRYVLSPQCNGSAPACSARRKSGKEPGTRAGQASLLCADGRTRDSAREHEEADYVGRKQFPWPNSWFNDRNSTAPTAPTELRHRTLDAFDPATSSATPNRMTIFDFRA